MIVLIKQEKIFDLMNCNDKLSYISLSLNSRMISITKPIRDYIYFLSFEYCEKEAADLNGFTYRAIISTNDLDYTRFIMSHFLKSYY
jgi:hypothetical protein